jgi:hypothetical protein
MNLSNQNPMKKELVFGRASYFKFIGTLFVIGTFLILGFGSGESKSNSTSKKDYSNTDAYKSGKAAGQTAKVLGGSSYCSGDMAQEQGACVNQVSKDAWCEGYDAGYNGN